MRLAEVTVLLPTRRACRTLAEAFLRQSDGRAMLLPAMRPLGDVDEEELALSGAAADAAGGLDGGLDVPDAITGIRRQLLLARLIQRWWQTSGSGPDGGGIEQAALLAGELARLLDRVQTARLSFDHLHDLVPEDYAAHWQITIAFLSILTAHWPEILAAEDAVDPAERRNALLEALAARWRDTPPATPVIAAGSTGSVPATADLLAVVARLPQGAVVLPGLDRHLDDESWNALEESHPQFGLKRLLHHLGVEREAVAAWPAAPKGTPPARARLLSEAMRPERTSDRWRRIDEVPAAALDGLSHIACEHPEEEAGVIALLMREVLESPAATATLVTPDRSLARRAAAALGRWGIAVDDSGGRALADTAPGSFLRLALAAVAGGFAPIPLLAALKHPLAVGSLAPGAFRNTVRRLEKKALRGPRPAPGIGGLRAALASAGADGDLLAWLDEIGEAAAPLSAVLHENPAAPATVVAAHIAFCEWLAGGSGTLWSGEAGEAARDFMVELAEAAAGLAPLPGSAYPALLDALLAGRVVRPHHGAHPRLAILGPLEARLQHADLVILGGLNEGTWPRDPAIDPWMSRPMQRAFGLPTPERWIGLAAHDFAQLAAAPRVVLTRSRKVDGAPTVPSRWLSRLETLLHGRGLTLARSAPHRLWSRMIDRPERIEPRRRPEPRPPVDARPRQLSVTAIETWMRDPYSIFARHILELKELDPIDDDPGAAERGTFIHAALDRFVCEGADLPPEAAFERLLAIGRECCGDMLAKPGVWAFWWPRFERVALWFVEKEHARRGDIAATCTEVSGHYEVASRGGAFRLTAKADRIDRLRDGGLVIIDYKTGTVPNPNHVRSGLSPQLPLEALIAEAGGFEGVAPAAVASLEYWQLSGGRQPAEAKPAAKDSSPQDLAEAARDGLLRLIHRFDDPATPYYPRPHPWPELVSRYSPYEHLARVREWSIVAGDD